MRDRSIKQKINGDYEESPKVCAKDLQYRTLKRT